MSRVLIGLAILAVAVGICWGVVVTGQAHGGRWITTLIGAARMGIPPLVETVFNVLVFVPLILIAVIAAAFERRNALAPGRRAAAGLGIGLLVGLGGLSTAVLYAKLAGTLADGVSTGATATLLAWGAGVVLLQTAAEEIYFRGWLQPALTVRWGQVAGIVAGALAFGALHVAGGAREPLSLLNLFLGGLMFGLFAARSGGLATAIGAHFAWNAAEQLGWGLDPNPGIGPFGAAVDKELVGATMWGGSTEGLNGSIGMTIVLLAILLPLVLLSWRRLPAAAMPVTARPVAAVS
ncbi:lysostaphin resistance A-like protein [Sphingomonas sp.]|uniref:CPBP family intramembrane glutamic endopeptidase n=1 Tax=Sphingomonas sp. TaxID=28214 RepID=UPI003CC58E9A